MASEAVLEARLRVTEAQAAALKAAGLDTVRKVRRASRSALLAVEGIDAATATRLRRRPD